MSTLRKMVFNIRVIVFMIYLPCVSAHGLMLWPPSRQSAWRVGYYELNRINYNDNQLYCGGIKVRWCNSANGTKTTHSNHNNNDKLMREYSARKSMRFMCRLKTLIL